MTESSRESGVSGLYAPIALVIFGVPLICGLVVIIITLIDARDSVRVWRSEFQYAIEEQCPEVSADIEGGAGRVYLDAYQLNYMWENDDLFCDSDGRVIRCNCREDEGMVTDVSAFRE